MGASELQTSLDFFYKWRLQNKLTINIKKTKLMVFGMMARVKKSKNVRVTLKGEALQVVPMLSFPTTLRVVLGKIEILLKLLPR